MNRVPAMRLCLSMIVAATLLLAPLRLPAEPPVGHDGDIAALRTQVEALREAVQAMQLRLDAIETQLGNGAPLTAAPAIATPDVTASAPPKPGAQAHAATSTPPPAGGATADSSARTLTPQIVESWDGLHESMEPADVRRLLGEPSRRFELRGQSVWYYHYTGVGSGSVMFSRGDGRVMSWQRPPFHGWW